MCNQFEDQTYVKENIQYIFTTWIIRTNIQFYSSISGSQIMSSRIQNLFYTIKEKSSSSQRMICAPFSCCAACPSFIAFGYAMWQQQKMSTLSSLQRTTCERFAMPHVLLKGLSDVPCASQEKKQARKKEKERKEHHVPLIYLVVNSCNIPKNRKVAF